MSETNEESTRPPESAPETRRTNGERHDGNRLLRFGQRHPALTVAGIAGAGLFGGIEMAAGVLLGAGVAALIRRRGNGVAEPVTSAERHGRIHRILERTPHDLRDLKQRARAVMSAALGESSPEPSMPQQKPAEPSGSTPPA